MPRHESGDKSTQKSSNNNKNKKNNNNNVDEKACVFCNSSDDDELKFGKIYEHNGLVTHYYCLLLSSNMQQRGEDEDGILGFLADDIQKELRRGKRLYCSYCKRNGATLGCCNTKCKRIFHYPCGLKAGSLHQFFGEFRSYCVSHRPRNKAEERFNASLDVDLSSTSLSSSSSSSSITHENSTCYICLETVKRSDKFQTLWAPCCKKNAWFHRNCVQRLAMSAGYFFKCPLCNNKKEFQKAMLDRGIFIPCQDASWELVPHAFEELLYRHNRCDAKLCRCPKGRSYSISNAKWDLILCRTCGSQGIHVECGKLKWLHPLWDCTECSSILNKNNDNNSSRFNDTSTSSSSSSSSSNIFSTTTTTITNNNNNNNNISEDSDSDISVGVDTPMFDYSLQNKNNIPIKIRPGPRSFKLKQQEINCQNKNGCNSTFIGPRPETSSDSDSSNETPSNENTKKIINNDIIVIDSDDESSIKKTPSINNNNNNNNEENDDDDDDDDNTPPDDNTTSEIISSADKTIENNVDNSEQAPEIYDTPDEIIQQSKKRKTGPSKSRKSSSSSLKRRKSSLAVDELSSCDIYTSPPPPSKAVELPSEICAPSLEALVSSLEIRTPSPSKAVESCLEETLASSSSSKCVETIEIPTNVVEQSTMTNNDLMAINIPKINESTQTLSYFAEPIISVPIVHEKINNILPTMNIQITNVTSLPPEVFDWTPETSTSTLIPQINNIEKPIVVEEKIREKYSPEIEDITQEPITENSQQLSTQNTSEPMEIEQVFRKNLSVLHMLESNQVKNKLYEISNGIKQVENEINNDNNNVQVNQSKENQIIVDIDDELDESINKEKNKVTSQLNEPAYDSMTDQVNKEPINIELDDTLNETHENQQHEEKNMLQTNENDDEIQEILNDKNKVDTVQQEEIKIHENENKKVKNHNQIIENKNQVLEITESNKNLNDNSSSSKRKLNTEEVECIEWASNKPDEVVISPEKNIKVEQQSTKRRKTHHSYVYSRSRKKSTTTTTTNQQTINNNHQQQQQQQIIQKNIPSIYKNGISLDKAAFINVLGNNFVVPLDVIDSKVNETASSSTSSSTSTILNYDGDAGTTPDDESRPKKYDKRGIGNNENCTQKINQQFNIDDIFQKELSSTRPNNCATRLMNNKILLKNLKFKVNSNDNLKIIISKTCSININIESMSKSKKLIKPIKSSTDESSSSSSSSSASSLIILPNQIKNQQINQFNLTNNNNNNNNCRSRSSKFKNDAVKENLAPHKNNDLIEKSPVKDKKINQLRDSSNDSTNSDDGLRENIFFKTNNICNEKIIQNVTKPKKNIINNIKNIISGDFNNNNNNNNNYRFIVSIDLSKIPSFVESNPDIFKNNNKNLKKQKKLLHRSKSMNDLNNLLSNNSNNILIKRTSSYDSITTILTKKIKNDKYLNSIDTTKQIIKNKKIHSFENHSCVR
ncbi:putative mediator of RNA polymerase II transcription subunit 26 [Aphidius gifuensis]|uniref:putative mediator of RNA polymerase II transcription subunit 26 n=1 Tax=Aphidius gifuensis TaxID=684658 RepID=UPI001CDD3083|nr:putative mediator of RNA polymerase II transcription subunit 26 [Aphidius gifuensis]